MLMKLRKFTNLHKLMLSENNIYSFIQISKLEALTGLSSISIENNEVSETMLLRTFIVYRFPNVREVSGKPVSDNDRLKARQSF